VKKPQMAIKVYERMPASSPLKRNAQIQLATNLDAADRSDEAIKILKGVTSEAPKDIEAIMALGNIERGRKKFSDCATTYTQAIDAAPGVTDKNTWVTYYYRGICEERSKQWSKAEADMRKALEVFDAFDKVLPRHPLIVEEMAKVKAGEKLPLLVTGPQAGAAEALYGLGASLGRRGGEDLGLVYLQLALHLSPNHSLALLSLADLYESLKKPDMAIKVYERIPANSPACARRS
jgi:tetratricopeptide (TPR) repeat protein